MGRLTLIRTCYTCGRSIITTADTPFVRQIAGANGKGQATVYFCSEGCKAASYKHRFDGLAAERRKARDAARDTSAKNRKYYETHAEQERARSRARYHADPEAARLNKIYSRRKRRLRQDTKRGGCA
jgi:hypothetical protein